MAVKNVILVEDDPDDRDLFHHYYSDRDDIKLLPSLENGSDLVNYLKTVTSNEHLPDLIVLDQNMPKLNGKQTLAFIKSDARYASIATVIYSTYTDRNLIGECLKLGAGMVATKPIDEVGYHKLMDDFLKLL